MNALCLYLAFLVFATRKGAQSITSEEIHQWVDGHNDARLKVAKGEVDGQPSASRMNTIIWDHELHAKAQAFADTHPVVGHNPDLTDPSGRFIIGENMFRIFYTSRNYEFNPSQAINSWFGEHVNYTYGKFNIDEPETSLYTQVVWSKSVYLGCGFSEEYDGQRKNVYAVCNYGPTGNIIGRLPYKKGGPVHSLSCGCGKKCNNCNNIYGGS